MAKIVFIGAGSLGFTRRLMRDILKYPRLRDCEVVLVDTHPGRLKMITEAVQRIIDFGKFPARITLATNDRRKALKGADAVLCTILSGGVEVWQHDILIPGRYGIDYCVGDTRGPAGIFRALRTVPTMIEICRDIEKLCPDAIFLNYTNPMAMLCNVLQRQFPHLKISGLCHSVQGTAAMLAEWAGVKPADVDYVSAGINHLSWYLKFEHKGKDLYPKIRKKILNDKKIYAQEPVRNELFLAFDHYVTESSGHNSEYNWWFRKRADQRQKYCTEKGTNGISYGESRICLKAYLKTARTWEKKFRDLIKGTNAQWLSEGGDEYASYIIDAFVGNDPFIFNGNVLNTGGRIANLPHECTVEIPVAVTRRGFEPLHVGPLPDQLVPLTALSAQVEVMAMNGAMSGNPELVCQAICNDPLTAAVLDLIEIRKMTQDLFKANRTYLKYFKGLDRFCKPFADRRQGIRGKVVKRSIDVTYSKGVKRVME